MENQEKINKVLSFVNSLLRNIENDTQKIKVLLKRIEDWTYDTWEINESELKSMSSGLLNYDAWSAGQIVEWIYDGMYMVGSDEKKYPVPLNYSSKSKLIPQDILKLTILPNGKLMYKLISPAPRSYIKATLSSSNNEYMAISDDWKTYKLNPAAITYFDLQVWEQMSVIVNSEGKWEYGAVEAKL